MTTGHYTTQLQAGLGVIDETRALLQLWHEGMGVSSLYQAALDSGGFRKMSARRLRNLVAECFAPRFLADGARPAELLKTLLPILTSREYAQLLFIYTCRANAILGDFVQEVYWRLYASGRETISNDDARDFVKRANQEGKTSKFWSEGTVRRVAAYLTGCCAYFGLLAQGRSTPRRILPYHIEPRVAAVFAYELHSSGRGDNQVLSDPGWGLFGLGREDVLEELKRLALKSLLIVQTAGSVTRIGWQCKDLKELTHVLAQS